MLLEDGTEPVLDGDGHAQIGAVAFQNAERGGGEDAIAQGPHAEDRNPAASRQTFQKAFHCKALHGLFFDLRLVDQHDGDVVANRVHAMALNAFQAALVGLEFDCGLTKRAHEDFEQIFADGHSEVSV
jgi:hypothetical protein